MVMSADAAEQPLAPELDAVATAAERQLRTLASEEPRTQIISARRSPTRPPPRSPQATRSPPWPTPNSADSSVPAPRSHASCSPGSSAPPAAGARQNTTFTRRSPAPPGSDLPTARSPRPRRSRTAPSARSSPAPTATPHPRRPSPSRPHQRARARIRHCRPDAHRRPLASSKPTGRRTTHRQRGQRLIHDAREEVADAERSRSRPRTQARSAPTGSDRASALPRNELRSVTPRQPAQVTARNSMAIITRTNTAAPIRRAPRPREPERRPIRRQPRRVFLWDSATRARVATPPLRRAAATVFAADRLPGQQ